MTYQRVIANGLDYATYRFGRSRQLFRGPKPELDQPYIACVGGAETFGKFVLRPFATHLEDQLEITVANLGTPGGGPTFYLDDPVLLETLSAARVCVVQAMGAWALSNRLYTVRRRRNERLAGTSEMLRALYPALDLTQFRYAQNMLARLYAVNPQNFRLVEMELRAAWVARMRELLDRIETRKILFWFSERRPEDEAGLRGGAERLCAPAFVDRAMLDAVAPHADAVVEYVAPAQPVAEAELPDPSAGPRGYPSAAMHEDGAAALAPIVRILAGVRDD